MNNKRRKSLSRAVALLRSALDIVEMSLDDEQECMDNLPGNLQYGDRYDSMEAAADNMAEAASLLDDAINDITKASELISDASI